MKNRHWLLFLSSAVCFAAPNQPCSCAEMAQDPKGRIIAISVLLEPDQTMAEKALEANSDLRKSDSSGYVFDESHIPHVTLLQRYIRERDLDQVFGAMAAALRGINTSNLKMRAESVEETTWDGLSMVSIKVAPTPELKHIHQVILKAVGPFASANGTSASFVTDPGKPGVDPQTIEYVGSFVQLRSGKNWSPHFTVGLASKENTEEIRTRLFAPFDFGTSGVAIYEVGEYGTARKKLWP